MCSCATKSKAGKRKNTSACNKVKDEIIKYEKQESQKEERKQELAHNLML